MSVRASVRAHWLAFTRPMEGSIAWLYLDRKFLVTIADGVLIRTAPEVLQLALVRKDGTPATSQEKLDDWQRVHDAKHLAEAGWRAAEKVAQLRLTPEALEAATWRRFDAFVAYLVRHYPAFASWPADTQLAVLSMSWALGPGFEGDTHPRCGAAIRAGAWLTAAVESKIADNPPRTIVQRRLFLAGLAVIEDGGDPEQLTPASVTLAQLEARYLSGPPAGAVEGPVPGASEAVAVGWQAGVEAERNPERLRRPPLASRAVRGLQVRALLHQRGEQTRQAAGEALGERLRQGFGLWGELQHDAAGGSPGLSLGLVDVGHAPVCG